MSSIEIRSVDEILNWALGIPEYQRPYKWDTKNISELLIDIEKAISESNNYQNFKYRIGTIILHRKNSDNHVTTEQVETEDKFHIVDGQQRIISLILIKLCIEENFSCHFLKKSKFSNKVSQYNINKNYEFIREWFFMKDSFAREKFREAFKEILQAVVIIVEEVSEAFQLFDCQNSRGKSLDPHDLLKAYHLREMSNDKYVMEYAVKNWEEHDSKEIRELFELYMFPVLNWTNGNKSYKFTDKDIDKYKGIHEFSGYTYAKRAQKATPYFQLTQDFISGNDFFELVEHYLYLLKVIKTEICTNETFCDIKRIICKNKNVNTPEELDEIRYNSAGFKYAINLFFCALLRYYDKFHNFEPMAVKKLFVWAFMLRVDMENLGFASVNKYAIGELDGNYTNKIAMFAKIRDARVHSEISGIIVNINKKTNSVKSDKWKALHVDLRKIMGLEVSK